MAGLTYRRRTPTRSSTESSDWTPPQHTRSGARSAAGDPVDAHRGVGAIWTRIRTRHHVDARLRLRVRCRVRRIVHHRVLQRPVGPRVRCGRENTVRRVRRTGRARRTARSAGAHAQAVGAARSCPAWIRAARSRARWIETNVASHVPRVCAAIAHRAVAVRRARRPTESRRTDERIVALALDDAVRSRGARGDARARRRQQRERNERKKPALVHHRWIVRAPLRHAQQSGYPAATAN